MKRFLIKFLPVYMFIVSVIAVFRIAYTIYCYYTYLTSFPLWMSLLPEIIFGVILILVGVIPYTLIKKHN